MIKPDEFDSFLRTQFGVEAYFGVPDSILKHFCRYLTTVYGTSDRHVVGVNEGSCVALGAGRQLATGRPSCVYMQNSGLGNAVNPILSLTCGEVYNIPTIYLVGWRGAPGEKDEPQHVAQGSRTLKILEVLGLHHIVLDKDSTLERLQGDAKRFKALLDVGESVAFLVRKDVFEEAPYTQPGSDGILPRERTLETIISRFRDDLYIGTTGMTSREVFEIRERLGMAHGNDFLAVGSMGHASAIALGVATGMNQSRRVWCLDGDGAALMHMGAMTTIGTSGACGFVHVLLNNASHESVGKIPTVSGQIDFCKIAEACGYDRVLKVKTPEDFTSILDMLDTSFAGKSFVEIIIAAGARANLGRPTIPPEDSKKLFVDSLGRQIL